MNTMGADSHTNVKPQEKLYSFFRTDMLKHDPQYNHKSLYYSSFYILIANIFILLRDDLPPQTVKSIPELQSVLACTVFSSELYSSRKIGNF